MDNFAERYLEGIRRQEIGDEEFIKAQSVRMNVLLYSEVYALATLAAHSMNTALVAFIRAGKEAIWSKLDDEEREKAEQFKTAKLAELLGEARPAKNRHAPFLSREGEKTTNLSDRSPLSRNEFAEPE